MSRERPGSRYALTQTNNLQFTIKIHCLPSLPQSPMGQSIGYFGRQTPDPVLESRVQVTSMSHWPQQQLPTKTSLPNKLSYSQSRDPGRVQGCPGVGGMGVEQNDPRSISTVKWKTCLWYETWCHCCPVETPAIVIVTVICVEVDVHHVGQSRHYWWREVDPRHWRCGRVATALAHQSCPIAISNLDIVYTIVVNSKFDELQPQYFPLFHLYHFGPFQIIWVSLRIVWRWHNTWLNINSQVKN